MKVIFGCGGTAGHISPAIAIAEIIKKYDKTAEIAFIGTEKGMENRIVSHAGYPFFSIHIAGFSRSLSIKNIRSAFFAMRAPKEAEKILKNEKPDLVIGTGGYVSWPCAVAAHRLKIPVLLHESNAVPGLSIRMSEKYADRILLNFEEAGKKLTDREKTVTVGNPVRKAFFLSKEKAEKELGIDKTTYVILSFGGSLGAETINRAVLDTADEFLTDKPNAVWYHATGKRYFESFMKAVTEKGLPSNFHAVPYFDKMGYYMLCADTVIARSGASTISEIETVGVPAILIPSPNVTGNHQYYNAEALKNRGETVLIEEAELSNSALISEVTRIYNSAEVRTQMITAQKASRITDTEDRILREILKVCPNVIQNKKM